MPVGNLWLIFDLQRVKRIVDGAKCGSDQWKGWFFHFTGKYRWPIASIAALDRRDWSEEVCYVRNY